jgi:hypothetical protein
MTLSRLCIFIIAFCFSATASAAEPQLRVLTDAKNHPTAIEAVGVGADYLAPLSNREADDPEWTKLLRVLVANLPDQDNTAPPVAGLYEVIGGTLRFTPRFAFLPGTAYRAELSPPRSHRQTLDISIPAGPKPPLTKVTAAYPSASILPENQLRFYIHFSQPMNSGEAYRHVKLLKASGEEVKRAFLEIGEELWDGSGQRLTLLFDPGRVKKGLKPREEFGPVLEPGQSYVLVIDKAWRDASNQPLADGFEKRFTAGPAMESAVKTAEWKVLAPAANSQEPLVVRFPRPLDRALLQRMISVVDSAGKFARGDISLADEERRWEFRPDAAWKPGDYSLVVDVELEDTAGNNIARAFEIDVFERIEDRPGPQFVKLPFTIAK